VNGFEAFYSTLKAELGHRHVWATRAQARRAVVESVCGGLSFQKWVGDPASPRPGLWVRTSDLLAAARWARSVLPAEQRILLPDVSEIPYLTYDRLYQREENHF
jgi:hypothetical protein